MHSRKVVPFFVLTIGVLLLLTYCATTKTVLPTDNIDELIGTWINLPYTVYGPHLKKWKCVYNADMTVELYTYQTDNPALVCSIEVKEKWVDEKGAIYFKDTLITGWGNTDRLLKISADRKLLEALFASNMKYLPTELNPEAPYCLYLFWYRQ